MVEAVVSFAASRPASRRYGSEHAKARRVWAAKHRPDDVCGWCGLRLGPMGPGLHLAHDPSGRVVLGFWHAACNQQEAGQRGRARQTRRASPLVW